MICWPDRHRPQRSMSRALLHTLLWCACSRGPWSLCTPESSRVPWYSPFEQSNHKDGDVARLGPFVLSVDDVNDRRCASQVALAPDQLTGDLGPLPGSLSAPMRRPGIQTGRPGARRSFITSRAVRRGPSSPARSGTGSCPCQGATPQPCGHSHRSPRPDRRCRCATPER
jgi:hypothetical protein